MPQSEMKGVDRQTMEALDRRATDEFGIPDLILMENAGVRAADLILEQFSSLERVAIFCGKGKNGGDGFVVARHLFLSGKKVSVFLVGDEPPTDPSSGTNWTILQKIGCPLFRAPSDDELERALQKERPFALAVDALLGIGLKGDVREPLRSAIRRVNRLKLPVVSLDIPSGLCADTGRVLGVAVKADWTVTFGLPKQGLFLGEGPRLAGRVVVKPIGLPP